ncbi:MAG TPA: cysteine desulfurase [Vicinamibacterales bacterium]|nr:cysteine desulfurase [Vicinamibacterales bacterium]
MNTTAAFDVAAIRAQFPALRQSVHGKPLVYLDNAATTQKPRAVLDAILHYYERDNANIHRGVHELSQRATEAHDASRGKVRAFLNARSTREIVFTRNATESINLVAQAWGRANLREGDEVLITGMEHHSNIVPWQLVCGERGARLKVAPIDQRGALIVEEFERMLTPAVKIAAFTQLSNALGTINPVAQMTALCRARGITTLVDGSQAVYHMAVDVQAIGCDFYVFTGHKLYGPTGIGVLYGREALLDAMPPYQGGGDMIRSVTFEGSTWNDLPYKFEAGTPHIEGAIALGAAIDFVQGVGWPAIAAHERELLGYAQDRIGAIDGIRLIGTAPEKASVISFVVEGVHPHDLGTFVDRDGVAIRTGHHCAQPVMDFFGISATARASLAMYNTREEIDVLAASVERAQRMFV